MATPESAAPAVFDAADGGRPCPAGFVGEFETHVTVDCDGEGLAWLEDWAAQAAVKLVHIVLGRGRVRSQPMVTFTGTGTLDARRTAAALMVRDLEQSGFQPSRVKIEAAPWNSGVPQNAEDARRLGPEFYFEHHIKLVLPAATDLNALAGSVIPHDAHLSWNARRIFEDGDTERFVTQRCHDVGFPEAGSRLSDLCDVLLAHGHRIVSTVQEFVVFDSDATLDAGWIEQAASPVAP